MLYSADVSFIYSRDMSFSPYDIRRATSKKREKIQKVRMLIFRFSDPRDKKTHKKNTYFVVSREVENDKCDKKNTLLLI